MLHTGGSLLLQPPIAYTLTMMASNFENYDWVLHKPGFASSQTIIVMLLYRKEGWKPALNSEVRLNKSYIQVHMRTRGAYVLNKGAWPNASLARSFAFNTARYLAKKCAYLVKDMRIERGHSDFTVTLRCWDPRCSYIRAVQGHRSLCAYTRNAPNSEHLGEQSSITRRLIRIP